MRTARVQLPDGRVAKFEVPDDVTPEQIEEAAGSIARLTGESPAGATLPMVPEAPVRPMGLRGPGTLTGETPLGTPVGEFQPKPTFPLPENRLGPRATSPWHAVPQAALTELAQLSAGARALANPPLIGDPEARKQALATGERLKEEQKERFEEYPLSTIGGTVAPYFAIPQAAVSTLPRSIATGGGIGTVAGGGDPLQAGIGAVGGGVGYALGRALAAPASQLNPFQQRALAQGRAMGLRATPAQETGGRFLQMLENSLESNILTMGATQRAVDATAQQARSIAARAIGESGNRIDDLVLGDAARRIGGVFDDVGGRVTARLDDQFIDDLAAVEDSVVGSIVGSDMDRAVRDTVSRILDRAGDAETLTGRQITTFSSRLKKQARSLLRGEKRDPDLAFLFQDMADALDDLLIRNATPADAARLAQARDQWRNLVFLEQPGVVKGGEISERVLANVLRRRAKGEYQRGGRQGVETPTDQLFALGRFGEAFPALPSSGTAQRLSVPVAGSAVGGAAAMTGDLFTGAALGLGGPALLSRLYRRYPAATGLMGLPARMGPLTGGMGARTGIITPQVDRP